MESGYFLDVTTSWRCRETVTENDVGPSGSARQWLNASTSTLVVCNGSRSVNDTDVDEEMPRFNELSLVKTVVLLAMFVVAFSGNVATLTKMYRMRRRHSTINLLITHLAGADLIDSSRTWPAPTSSSPSSATSPTPSGQRPSSGWPATPPASSSNSYR